MNFQTNTIKKQMTYQNYIKEPLQMVERNLKLINAKNPQLINALDRSINHSLFRKYSNIPFDVQ